jgi:hypothetical protein
MMTIVEEMAEKYRLSTEDAFNAIEAGARTALEYAYKNMAMSVCLTPEGRLQICGRDKQGRSERIIPLSELSSRLIRQIHYRIEQDLQRRQVMYEFPLLLEWRGEVVMGEILKIDRGKSMLLELSLPQTFGPAKKILGRCLWRNVSISDRPHLVVGLDRAVIVTGVIPVTEKGAYRVSFSVSRQSKELPEKLLKRHTNRSDITCVLRMAGVMSDIEVTKPLRKDVIKSVAAELQERIRVHVRQKKI